MGRVTRVFVALTVAVAVLFVGTGMALAATVVSSGVVTVRVNEGGPEGAHVFVPVPAALIDVGLAIAAIAMPPEERARMREEVAPYQPTIAALARELERCPDAVLVEVDTDGQHVRVTKRGGTFLIDVETDEESVAVAVPARVLTKVARFLG